MMKFPTAESVYGDLLKNSPGILAGAPQAAWAVRYVTPSADVPADQGGIGPAVFVEVNAGRWIIRCPFCSSAQFASESDHRFVCVPAPEGCGSVSVSGKFVPVVWPGNTDAIEIALQNRPYANRNWQRGETINDLLDENAAMGVS